MIEKLQIEEKSKKFLWEGKNFELKTGKLASQSDGSVVVSLGDTSLLVTAVMNESPDEDKDFMPLTIDCRESFYAAGKIGGAIYIRREGKPSERTVLVSRLTDRPIRPMFPEGMINDVVITITPLSVDKENSMGVPSIIGASAALKMAGIPFEGPVGAVKIGYKDGDFIVNPTYSEVNEGTLELTLAGTEDTITMVECGAKEIPEDILIEAFKIGQEEIKKICSKQKEFLEKFEIEEREIKTNKPSEDLISYIKQLIDKESLEGLIPSGKKEFNKKIDKIEEKVLSLVNEKIEDKENNIFTKSKVNSALFKIVKEFIRDKILNKEQRVDGRELNQIRPLYCEVGLNSRIHGIGLFQRGETQVFSATTLGAPGDVLLVDDMESDAEEVRFMHHYNMPAFSTNEARPSRAASRREIGHGKLAEKAILPVLPNEEDFPYTLRVVSEVFSCNGSTSMASVCASTLSLMDAGVPIKNPVSGIAMGLVSDGENYKILTDIQGVEDFTGDMDFKVAGTKEGITALQMDMKIKGLKMSVIKEAISTANKARGDILDFMLETIDKPSEELSIHAPKITTIKLKPSQVREVIGSGGANINEITKQTGVKIDFKEDGTTIITAKDSESEKHAIKMIKDSTWNPEVGQVIEGTINRVEQYGLFVEVGKGKTGLCHVKNLGKGFISDPKTQYKEGQKIRVKIIGIDENSGKIELRKEE